MKMGIPLLALMIPCAACSSWPGSEFGFSQDDAAFRLTARQMYSSLRTPSCDAPKGFDRAAKLKPEHEAVHAYEQRAPSASKFHLAIASADADFEQKTRSGCWNDSGELVWAEKHVEMTREDVRDSLMAFDELAKSAPPLNAPAFAPDGLSAAFRADARKLTAATYAPCTLTEAGDNDEILAPARQALDEFKRGLSGTPYAVDFAIAAADTEYEMAHTIFECAETGREEPAKISKRILGQVKRQLTQMERLMKSQP